MAKKRRTGVASMTIPPAGQGNWGANAGLAHRRGFPGICLMVAHPGAVRQPFWPLSTDGPRGLKAGQNHASGDNSAADAGKKPQQEPAAQPPAAKKNLFDVYMRY
jgi:hypothetical protein